MVPEWFPCRLWSSDLAQAKLYTDGSNGLSYEISSPLRLAGRCNRRGVTPSTIPAFCSLPFRPTDFVKAVVKVHKHESVVCVMQSMLRLSIFGSRP